MKFQNYKIQQIWEKSQDQTLLAKDPYAKLTQFEQMLFEYMRFNQLSDIEKLEGHKTLAMINSAQIKLLEIRLNADLNGDGVIGK